MKPIRGLTILLAGLTATAGADIELRSPGFPPSTVDAQGAIHEKWGTMALQIQQPEGAAVAEHRYEESPVPMAVTVKSAGAVKLTETVYHAPTWPSGVDVVEATLANTAAEPQNVVLQVLLPETVGVGERVGVAGGHPVLALPKGLEPVREEREWGCTGGIVALPGWARPQGECDPAFKNISAGMGGVPIVYRFGVPQGAERTVVLGFCESHWSTGGARLVEIRVEGAPKSEVDPVAAWGQHVPGCLVFDAKDADEDGRLEIVIAPHPKASDKNTILNAIWVFPSGANVDTDQIVKGEMNAAAERYVDVGGQNDQLLYKGGTLEYHLALEPNAEQTLVFLLETPAGGGVPNPDRTAWTPETLRKAAQDVWRDYDPARWGS